MKKTFLFTVGFTAILMTSCGGEKYEGKNDEKKTVTEETRKKAYDIGIEVGDITNEMYAFGHLVHHNKPMKYIEKEDSLLSLIGKFDKGVQVTAIAYLDSLRTDISISDELDEDHDSIQRAYEDDCRTFSGLYDKIQKSKISEEEAINLLENYPTLFEGYSQQIRSLNEKWIPISRHLDVFESILSSNQKTTK